MPRVLVTGSTTGLGLATAEYLLDHGQEVVLHARSEQGREALAGLLERGAQLVTGDLGDPEQVTALAEQANSLGPYDAVIHNAGVIDGPDLLQVNLLAPYVLAAGIENPGRLILLSSGMHRGGRADLSGLADGDADREWTYSDSKLLLTVLMAALARHWPDTPVHAVDPGWVPTRMGGPSASDDLEEGHRTQGWLAITDSPAAATGGGYWHHRERQDPHPAVHDRELQEALLDALATRTGVTLPAA